jgi:hypothetical protein
MVGAEGAIGCSTGQRNNLIPEQSALQVCGLHGAISARWAMANKRRPRGRCRAAERKASRAPDQGRGDAGMGQSQALDVVGVQGLSAPARVGRGGAPSCLLGRAEGRGRRLGRRVRLGGEKQEEEGSGQAGLVGRVAGRGPRLRRPGWPRVCRLVLRTNGSRGAAGFRI